MVANTTSKRTSIRLRHIFWPLSTDAGAGSIVDHIARQIADGRGKR